MALLIWCYLAAGIFFVAFIYRAWSLASMPVHLRWELAPVPHEKGKAHYGGSYFEEYEWWTKPREKSLINEAVYMAKEIFLLKGVWDHNRKLWKFSFPLHTGIYLLVAMAGAALLSALGLPWLERPASWLATAGYLLGCVGSAGLLVMRQVDSTLRSFTTPAARFNLAFLLVVFGTGAWTVLGAGEFGRQAAALFRSLAAADPGGLPPAPFSLHVALVMAFVVYLPFTQMMHFLAKYFTYHEVRWNDEPMVAGSRMESEVKALLSQPVSWSAAHLGADGKKNWVDIATKEEPHA